MILNRSTPSEVLAGRWMAASVRCCAAGDQSRSRFMTTAVALLALAAVVSFGTDAYAGCGDYLVFRGPPGGFVTVAMGDHLQTGRGTVAWHATAYRRLSHAEAPAAGTGGPSRFWVLIGRAPGEPRREPPCHGPQCGRPAPLPFAPSFPPVPLGSGGSKSSDYPGELAAPAMNLIPEATMTALTATAGVAWRQWYLAYPPFRPPRLEQI
jgi:hypothetical protein